ncbi:MAG: hypothetical protein ACT4P6_11290 [Gemmatimonadaceae bacterium]
MPRSPKYVLAILSLAGCTQLESPVAPQDDVLVSIGSERSELKSRPWNSRCEGTAMYIDPTTLRITGDCNITHVGRATVATIETAIPGPEGFILNASNTYTAANGDKLYTTSSGIATLKPDFSGVTFSAIEIAVGGTGRFQNATGRATRIGSTRFSDLRGSYRNVGELAYSASDGGR